MRQKAVVAMGESIGEVYHSLWMEFARLSRKWVEYKELFGDDFHRFTLLNRSAPLFFRMVQYSFLYDVLMHISRITDPPSTGVGNRKRENLTLKKLEERIDRADLKERLSTLLGEVDTKCEVCRKWRNRRLAHLDLDLAIGKRPPEPLERATSEMVDEALKSIANVLNAVSHHYQDSTTAFDHYVPSVWGVRSLLGVLEDGIKSRGE